VPRVLFRRPRPPRTPPRVRLPLDHILRLPTSRAFMVSPSRHRNLSAPKRTLRKGDAGPLSWISEQTRNWGSVQRT
jgi:hypothetical protein